MKININTKQGKGSRSVQQDTYGISRKYVGREKGILAVLSDGMGGMQAGETFSRIAAEEMVNAFELDDSREDMTVRLQNAYRAARNKALESAEKQQLEGGATVVAVLVHKGMCTFLSVGDSRIYLYRGGLIQLNREQVLGTELDEKAAFGLTLKREAKYNRYRDSVTNHLTMPEELPVDCPERPFSLLPGDRLVLLSDGVFRTLNDEEIERIVADPEDKRAKALIEAVNKRAMPDQDNYSAVVLSARKGE
ncbi:MAG: serine/threonine-protein phosphatase [Blautia sp.]|nr:serine/threonine-protein phosphatase [Blautia sp.]